MHDLDALATYPDAWTEHLVHLDVDGTIRLDPAVSTLTLSAAEAETLGRLLVTLAQLRRVEQ